MARYNLLTDDERHRLFGIPSDRTALIRHYTLTPEELEFVLARRGDRNRLGVALQLCLLWHPGFGLRIHELIPDAMLRYVATQLAVPAEVYRDYSRRPPTRIEHARELALRLGLRVPGRTDMPMMVDLAAETAWSTDKGFDIASALMEGLRERKIILPAPDTLDRAGATGRAWAWRLTADALVAPLTPDQLAQLDTLLLNDPELGRTPLAWLRGFPESPSADNINTILARLDHVRRIGLEPALADAIHESRFRQFVREGAVAPAFLLSAYGLRRRRATLIAQMIDRFHAMIRRKAGRDLEPWIEEARASLIASFANGVTRNRAAVRAAITSPWSNGQTEGQITRLKLVKRQMYGRAKIDLLQARLIGKC